MGSSGKRKTNRKKDFQKPKLKLGKPRPKASNVTDTSFKSKGIVLKEQSIFVTTPTTVTLFSRNLSFLTSHSDSKRRESLKHLCGIVTSRTTGQQLPIPSSVLLPKLLPLMISGNDEIREQLLKLLRCLTSKEIENHAEQILLFIRAGMTHLAVGCQVSAMEFLSWALGSIGDKLVSCPSGWIKTLKHFCVMLGWHLSDGIYQHTARAGIGSRRDDKLVRKALDNLIEYLRKGLVKEKDQDSIFRQPVFPLNRPELYFLPESSNLYTHMNLFGMQRDDDGQMYSERDDRCQALRLNLLESINSGLRELKSRGGEIGRAAATAEKVMEEGMAGFESID